MSNTVSPESLAPSDVDGSTGSRRTLLLLGGLAVLLVLAIAGYFLFLSGSSEEDLGLVPSGAAPQQTKDASGKDDEKKADQKADEKSEKQVKQEITVGRDPFAPLSVEAEKIVPVDDDADGGSSGSTGTSGSSGTKSDTVPPTAPQPTTAPTTAPTTEPIEPEESYKVTLRSVEVKKGKAVIEVDGKRYLVNVKEMFTDTKTGPFKLVWVGERSNGTATAKVVFGSDAPVLLVEKDSVVFET